MLNESEWHKWQCKDKLTWYKFNLLGKNTDGFQFGNIVLRFSAGPSLKIRFLGNEIKLSPRIWQLWRKTEFLRTFWFGQVFSQSYGHQSLCSIHVIKSTHPNFNHTKFEPDMSNHARKKWGVKIAPVFPGRSIPSLLFCVWLLSNWVKISVGATAWVCVESHRHRRKHGRPSSGG